MAEKRLFDIDEIKKVKIDKDDIIILRFKGALTEATIKNIKDSFWLHFKNEVIILEEGIELSILTKDDAEQI